MSGFPHVISLQRSYKEHDRCGKKQESPVQVSRRHPTLDACWKKMRKRLEENHGNYAEALTIKTAADAASEVLL
jgi:hypothetical protein